jgi:hypothetical protein
VAGVADWQAIKTEYITTDTSYRKLAQKYGIHYKVISERGKDEKWVELRSQHKDRTLTKTLDKISNKQADKMARIDDLADKLLEKLEQAITELDLQLAKHTDKTKTIEYNNDLRPDKPTKEVVHEEEKLLEVKSIVDRQGLKQIASALKDIKEVKMLRSELDKQEQEARIAALRQKSMTGDGDDDDTGVILLPPRIGEDADND